MRSFPLVMVAAMALPAGCSNPQATVDPFSTAPDDFTLDLTVLTGRGVPEDSPVHLRQGKAMLLADGTLHADWGEGVSWDTRPGLTRTLRREQVTELWELARQLGVSDPAAREQPVNLGLVEPDRGEVVYLLAMTAGDDRWTRMQRGPADGEVDPVMMRLTRALAALAWASDERLEEGVMAPVRYDFGPDPYAPYRSSAASPP
jgi:hypothetical protein